jgi:transcriptional regulator with XRE-family HTH domain
MTDAPRALPPKTTTHDLAVSLAILRIIRGRSQSELAEAAGVTNSAISDYERGKVDPQTQTLQKLLRALGLPLSALDQTQAFILLIRSQMTAGGAPSPGEASLPFSDAAALSPEERAVRREIAEVASEAGRFASRFTHLILELMASSSHGGTPCSRT